jgi:hypothetical protein
MLEFDDIQHMLLTRMPAITGRYEFLSFATPEHGRAWLKGVIPTVLSAQAAAASIDVDRRWVSVAFTWSGLQALGLNDASLASFPEEFRQGMAARADALGDTGANHPDNWVGGLASPDLHAIAILFARSEEDRERSVGAHDAFLARTDRRSSPGNSSLATTMSAAPSTACRSPRCSRGMAPSWPTAGCKSMSGPSGPS